MKYTLSPIWPVLVGIALVIAGVRLHRGGGRPMLFGAMALWGLGAAAVLLGVALSLPPRFGVPLLRLLLFLAVSALLCLAALLVWVAVNTDSRVTGEPKTMVVLGANLWNHEPSPILMERLEVAADYLNAHPEMNVVVTGGMGNNEPISEAFCMARVLKERGVAPERILLEEAATNTHENLKNTKALLEERGASTDNLLVVSTNAHLARVRLLARRNGLSISTLSAPLPGGVRYKAYFCLRESAALVKSFLLDRG